ncbi:MAG: TRAP transporter substrate-binding protein [Hydrogenophilus thermoluteolus]
MLRFSRYTAAFFVSIFILVMGAPAKASEPVTLKISHYLPPSHGIHRDFIEPWAKALEEKSNGTIKVEIYPGNTAFGNVAKQMDQVRAGVVDIAHGLAGIPRGRMPRTAIMDLPFLTRSADVASKTLWKLYQEGLVTEDYRGVKVLALHCHNPGLFHTRDKPVKTPEDVKGLRLRTPSPAISETISYLGGTPVGLPPSQVYENLQKGVLDGTVFTWDAVGAFRLNEVLQYHTDARAYTTCFYFVMNRQRYENLPAEAKRAIDELSGDTLVARFGSWWDKWDAAGRADAEKRGHQIIELSDAERAHWQETLNPMINMYLEDLAQKEGVTNSRTIYQRAKELIQLFEGQR